MNDARVFSSAMDMWLVGILLIVPVTLAALLVGLVLTQQETAVIITIAVALALNGAMTLWILLSTRYVLTASELIARCGPFTFRVPLSQITRIEPTRSPASAPALSLDRLAIHSSRGVLLVSPRDKASFIAALKNPRAR